MSLPAIVESMEIAVIIMTLELIRLIISRGANFCQVSNKNKVIQAIFLATLGNHKWSGAPPSLRTKERTINNELQLLENIEYQEKVFEYMISEAIISKLDLNLWIIKYFIEDSASKVFPLMFIKGKNPIKLSSKPIHIVNQWEEDIVNKVPIIMIIRNKKFEGKNLLFIKGRTVSSCSK